MKKIFLALSCTFFIAASFTAQAQCSGRYYDKIFPSFFNWETFPLPSGLPTPVVYGSAEGYTGSTETLDMYVFQPQGDTLQKRPLVILAFGGSFVIGAKESPDIVALCSELTARGFVTASIKYRIGVPTVDSLNMLKAVMRGVQDAKAAVRFFYKDAATTNTYRIDTNNIFMGGVSAGAFIGTHLGYIDDEAEMPQWLHDIAQTIGGFEGNSGNPGYSSKIKGIINLAGAIGDTSWIDADDPAMVSIHGTDDGTVPYCSEIIVRDGNEIIMADGSAMMKYRTNNLCIKNPFYTHQGGGHVDFTNYFFFQPQRKPLVDTTIWFIRDFLYEMITGNDCGETLRNAGNFDSPCGAPVEEVVCEVGIRNVLETKELQVFPNPAENALMVTKPSELGLAYLKIHDSAGKLIRSFSFSNEKFLVKSADVASGFYILTLTAENSTATYRTKVIFQ